VRLLLAPLALFLRAVPDAVHVSAVALAADRVLRNQGQDADLADLEGRSIALEVSDIGNRWQFRVEGRRLRADRSGRPADVVIRGALPDLVALALRAEDPDTLFFQRRLVLEGDTEAGLLVKYLIDGFELDWDAQLGALIGPRAAARARALAERSGAARAGERLAGRLRERLVTATRE